jgi:hypothetical protein
MRGIIRPASHFILRTSHFELAFQPGMTRAGSKGLFSARRTPGAPLATYIVAGDCQQSGKRKTNTGFRMIMNF